MRLFIAVIALMLLAACETATDWRAHNVTEVSTIPHATPRRNAIKPVDPNDTYCRDIAQRRAEDAKENRFADDIQNLIYRGTYKDCIAWSSQHAG